MRDWMRLALSVGCLLVVLVAPSRAGALGLQPVGTFDSPIYVTAPPGDPRLFVVERPGRIRVVHDGVVSQFLDIHTMVDTTGERALQSIAFDPNYATNGLFYVFFNDNGTGGATAGDIHVDEFRVSTDPNVASAASRRQVLTIPHSSASNHNGGQLQFGRDGLLYITVGEAGNGSNAQTTSNLLGKVLRIDPHGATPGAYTVPASNPFTGGDPGRDEIWSLGLRNPFRFSFDHATGDLVIADVGAGSFEEIDFAPGSSGLGRGANFGWPSCEGFSGTNCSGPTFTAPVFAYGHSAPCNALIGGYVYRGSQIPELAGRYLYTDLCHPGIRSIQLGQPLASGDRAEGISAPSSPNSFGEDANCELYVMGSNSVQKIVGSGTSVAPSCRAAAGPVTGGGKSCKRQKKRRHRAAAAKKRKKLCVRGSWASRL